MNETRQALIHIQLSSWWLAGTGAASAGDLDAPAYRDRFGCPAIPMTQVKGQLRETAERLASVATGGWSTEVVDQLFGTRDGGLPKAALAFRGDASLDDESARWFARHPAARARLFQRIASTAIEPNGVARDDSLRAVEAVVPVTLTGSIRWVAQESPEIPWVELLDNACAATLAFGKLKADGYGRAIARCLDAGKDSP